MFKASLFLLLQFFVINVTAQSISITKATLDKQILFQNGTEKRVGGEIYIDYEISNTTKDTLFLVLDEFDFLEKIPVIINQSQKELQESKIECGGYFVYNRPPSAYYVKVFDPKKNVIKVAPKAKLNRQKNITVEEGFCPNSGNKIEISIDYSLKFNQTTIENYLEKYQKYSKALQILTSQLKEIEQNETLKENNSLLKELNASIHNLNSEIRYFKNRMTELELLAKIPLFKGEIKSNSVFINK